MPSCDRANCALKAKIGTDPKTAIYECISCGHKCTGFVAWRNHMKKKKRFERCAPPPPFART